MENQVRTLIKGILKCERLLLGTLILDIEIGITGLSLEQIV